MTNAQTKWEKQSLRVLRAWLHSKLAAWLTNPKHLLFTLVIAVFLSFYVWLLFFLPSAEVLTAASIQTEKISFEDVFEKSAFPVYGMRASVSDATSPALAALDRQCVDGLFHPTRFARVTYGRVGQGPLEIDVARGSVASTETTPVLGAYEARNGDRPLKIVAPIYFEWDKKCAEDHAASGGLATQNETFPPPLPVWGTISVGGEFQPITTPGLPPPRLLLSGDIRVSAHSIHISDKLGFVDKPTIYTVTSLHLPVGSRLVAAPEDDGKAGNATNWWGVVYVDSSKPALSAEVATNASKLLTYHANLSKPDLIQVATLTQLTNDPQIIRLHFCMVVVISFFGILGWFAEKLYRSREKKDK